MVKYFRFCLIIAYVVQINLMLSMTSQSVANNALVLSKNNLTGDMQFPNTINDVISSNIDEILRMNNLSYNLVKGEYPWEGEMPLYKNKFFLKSTTEDMETLSSYSAKERAKICEETIKDLEKNAKDNEDAKKILNTYKAYCEEIIKDLEKNVKDNEDAKEILNKYKAYLLKISDSKDPQKDFFESFMEHLHEQIKEKKVIDTNPLQTYKDKIAKNWQIQTFTGFEGKFNEYPELSGVVAYQQRKNLVIVTFHGTASNKEGWSTNFESNKMIPFDIIDIYIRDTFSYVIKKIRESSSLLKRESEALHRLKELDEKIHEFIFNNDTIDITTLTRLIQLLEKSMKKAAPNDPIKGFLLALIRYCQNKKDLVDDIYIVDNTYIEDTLFHVTKKIQEFHLKNNDIKNLSDFKTLDNAIDQILSKKKKEDLETLNALINLLKESMGESGEDKSVKPALYDLILYCENRKNLINASNEIKETIENKRESTLIMDIFSYVTKKIRQNDLLKEKDNINKLDNEIQEIISKKNKKDLNNLTELIDLLKNNSINPLQITNTVKAFLVDLIRYCENKNDLVDKNNKLNLGKNFIKGYVHEGFFKKYMSTKGDLLQILRRMRSNFNQNTRVIFTGHSQGAALALLAYADITINHGAELFGKGFDNRHSNNFGAYVLSAPRAGDIYFREWLHKKAGKENIIRQNVMGDLVPVSTVDSKVVDSLNHIPVLGDLLQDMGGYANDVGYLLLDDPINVWDRAQKKYNAFCSRESKKQMKGDYTKRIEICQNIINKLSSKSIFDNKKTKDLLNKALDFLKTHDQKKVEKSEKDTVDSLKEFMSNLADNLEKNIKGKLDDDYNPLKIYKKNVLDPDLFCNGGKYPYRTIENLLRLVLGNDISNVIFGEPKKMNSIISAFNTIDDLSLLVRALFKRKDSENQEMNIIKMRITQRFAPFHYGLLLPQLNDAVFAPAIVGKEFNEMLKRGLEYKAEGEYTPLDEIRD